MSEIVTVDKFTALQPATAKENLEIVREALGAGSFNPLTDLTVIKVPSAGSTMWEIDTIEGPQHIKELSGVIIHHHDARGYWPNSIEDSGGGEPPQCSSQDGFVGRGDPGGDCASCPLAQYGSGKNNRQACKAVKLLYMIDQTSSMPALVVVPPTSLKAAKKYLLSLASQGLRAAYVISTLSLQKAKNKDGVQYSEIVFRIQTKIDAKFRPCIAEYATTIKECVLLKPAYIEKDITDCA